MRKLENFLAGAYYTHIPSNTTIILIEETYQLIQRSTAVENRCLIILTKLAQKEKAINKLVDILHHIP